ncbi:MAG: hypothetical protein QM504_09645 [Pseudomonadota bacterium]
MISILRSLASLLLLVSLSSQAGDIQNFGKALEKGVKDTANTVVKGVGDLVTTVDKAIKDTTETGKKAAKDTKKTLEVAEHDARVGGEKAISDTWNELDRFARRVCVDWLNIEDGQCGLCYSSQTNEYYACSGGDPNAGTPSSYYTQDPYPEPQPEIPTQPGEDPTSKPETEEKNSEPTYSSNSKPEAPASDANNLKKLNYVNTAISYLNDNPISEYEETGFPSNERTRQELMAMDALTVLSSINNEVEKDNKVIKKAFEQALKKIYKRAGPVMLAVDTTRMGDGTRLSKANINSKKLVLTTELKKYVDKRYPEKNKLNFKYKDPNKSYLESR